MQRRRMGNYDPFTYQPVMKSYYGGRQFPQTISALQAQYPQYADHIGAVYQFSNWLQQSMPEVWSKVNTTNPDLLNAGKVVLSGAITPANSAQPVSAPAGVSGLRGLRGRGLGRMGDGAGTVDTGGYTIDPNTGDVTGSPSTTTAPNGGAVPPYVPSSSTVTQWGTSLTTLASQLVTADAQKQLLQVNIQRAQMGLPPIDASQYGLGVNVGLSPGTTNLAIGALVLFGLYAAFSAVKKR